MSRCRFGWYERGVVRRHVAGRAQSDVPKDEPRHAANLRRAAKGIMVVEAEMDGTTWYGRLMPKKKGVAEGPVILFEKPRALGE